MNFQPIVLICTAEISKKQNILKYFSGGVEERMMIMMQVFYYCEL